ncbi:MAG: Nramp family divalent metal transporter [Halobacteriales archaeon]|nr:Nramp family divalent metal transporter [Halobacteriales archaeon]
MSTETGTARISEPPQNLREFFDYMGPAWVFTASQIGGGEALSVPIGGAYLGMEGIWLIPLITFTKIFGQYYLVRYGVVSGDSFLEAIFEQPWYIKWIFYYVFLGGIIYAMGLSGHLGETAGAFDNLMPIGINPWMFITVILGLAVVLTKSYDLVERISTVLLWAFLVLIAIASIVTIGNWGGEVVQAFTPRLPGEVEGLGVGGLGFIVVMSGWIGAGFGPTVSYVWFAKDKGMGMAEPQMKGIEISRDDLSQEEMERLVGWGDVVLWQNIISSVILAVFSFFMWTAAAATLFEQGIRPSGFDVIPEMAAIFTSVYGSWSKWVFLLAVIFALFSTLIGPLYGMSRMWEDSFALHGLFERYDIERDTVFRITVLFFIAIPLALNLAIQAPMILFSLSGILFAPAIGLMYLAAIYMAYTVVEQPELHPRYVWAVALGLFAAILMLITGLWESPIGDLIFPK